MKRLNVMLFLAILAGCAGFGPKAPTPVPPTIPEATPTPQPSSGIRFHAVSGYDAHQLEDLKKAEQEVNRLIASDCFKNFFMKRALIQTNGLTNAQVIEKIRNTNVNLPVQMYSSFKRVVGYVNPPDPTVHTNIKYYAKYGVCFKASNLGHESLHPMGFGHDFNNTSRRPFSVPYSFNRMAEVCCSID